MKIKQLSIYKIILIHIKELIIIHIIYKNIEKYTEEKLNQKTIEMLNSGVFLVLSWGSRMDTYPVLFSIPQNDLSCLVIARRLFVGEHAFRYGILTRRGFPPFGNCSAGFMIAIVLSALRKV